MKPELTKNVENVCEAPEAVNVVAVTTHAIKRVTIDEKVIIPAKCSVQVNVCIDRGYIENNYACVPEALYGFAEKRNFKD